MQILQKCRKAVVAANNSKSAANLKGMGLSALLFTATLIAVPAFGAPAAPSAPDMSDNTDSGSSFTDNITNINKPVFSGTGTALTLVKLFAGSTEVGTAVVNPYGQWSAALTTALADGSYVLTAKQLVGGVYSAASSPLNIVIDTTVPVTTKPDLTSATDFGTSNTDNFTNTRTPSFQGTGTPGAFISIYNTSVSSVASIGTATVSAQGTWIAPVQIQLPAGTHTYLFAAKARDAAGNASALSASLAANIDTDIPATPPVPDLVAASDSGSSQTDNVTSVTSPTFTAKGDPFSKVDLIRYNNAAVTIGSGIADSNGNVTITASAPIPEGYFNIYAKVTDRAGNPAASVGPSFLVQIDVTPPPASGKPFLESASDTNIAGDSVTSITGPFVSGSFNDPFNPGHLTITYFAGVFTYTTTVTVPKNAFGWTVVSPVLPSGTYNVTASNIDSAGNVSISPPLTLTIDNVAPILTLDVPASGTAVKSLTTASGTASDFHTMVTAVTLNLQRQSDSLYWNGSVWAGAAVPLATNLAGNAWSRTSWPTGANFPVGNYTVTARATDVAGNFKTTSTDITCGNSAPTNVSVTPSVSTSTAGTPKALAAVYSDINGATDIAQANIRVSVHNVLNSNLCANYDSVANLLYLYDDAGTTRLGGFAPGSAHVITNSQGSLNCATTTVSRSGNALTVNWSLTPAATYTGQENLYLFCKDSKGANSSTDDLGDWTITAPAAAAKVQSLTAPSGASG
jgi:hypothetical protein